MHFRENLSQAFRSLTANKLRSILTMLGIIMGVFSVVAIMAISNATQTFVKAELNKFGANTIVMYYSNYDLEPEDRFTLRDLDIIKEAIPEIQYASAEGTSWSDIKFEDETKEARVTGVLPEYTKFTSFDIIKGRFINQIDIDEVANVVFVSEYFAKRYFGTIDVLGEVIKLENHYGDIIKLQIVGVEKVEDNLIGNLNYNENYPARISIPLSTYREFYDEKYLGNISVSVYEGKNINEVAQKMLKLMHFVHDNKDMYAVQSVKEAQKMYDSILGVIASVLLVIAIITLIVGGIGIVNILLVSVTERIREIGIRKALGAKKRDIVLQFLTESIMITGFSGFIGIMLGIIGGLIISSVIKIPPVVDLKIILSTFTGSIMLGIIFGVYPAKKAADLDPIESLRYE